MAKSIGIKLMLSSIHCPVHGQVCVCVCLLVSLCSVWGLVRHVKEMDCNLWEF